MRNLLFFVCYSEGHIDLLGSTGVKHKKQQRLPKPCPLWRLQGRYIDEILKSGLKNVCLLAKLLSTCVTAC